MNLPVGNTPATKILIGTEDAQIKKLLPFDDMKAAIVGGICTNDFELAEYFEVTVELVESAVEYYTGHLGLSFRDEDEGA